jgi:serine/threonine-protein kinase
MNDDPTIPLGVDQAEGLEAPAVSSTWGGFTLLARVGVGGFGEVYRAWDVNLQREVALKLLLPGVAGGEAEYETMLREARALASVRHTNIVQVHGIDRHDGRVGFWTDFVRGKTLSALVAQQGTFGVREAALIGLDVARALSAVHRAGLLHRDIKAENVMREEGGRILLMDFGLSSLDQHQTIIAGTPNYMAPELFEGGPSRVATDIYAMGVLLYFLVTGEYPMRLGGMSPREALMALSGRRPLVDLRPDLPESLVRTVNTAMELDPAKRFTSAGQLATALAESLGTDAPAETGGLVAPAPPRKRWKREWIVAAVVLAAALVIGALASTGYLRRVGRPGDDAATAATGATSDSFQKAQDLLLDSYKESNLAEAVKGFQTVLAADPDNALAHAQLATAYFIQYRYSQGDDPKLLNLAKTETSRAISLDPDLAVPYVTQSRIAATEGHTQLATENAKKALALDPRSAEAYGALGEVYEAEGRNKDAIDAYQRAIDLAPGDWRWPMRLGNNQFRAGDTENAIKEFQRVVDLTPHNPVAYFNLGLADTRLNKMDEAQRALRASLKIEPTGRAYAALGSVLLLEGKYDDAAAMDQKSIQLNHDEYVAWGDLGTAYQWSGKQPAKAAEAFRKAIELGEIAHQKSTDDPELLSALADYYASIGQSDKSLTLIRQSLALASDNPSIEYQAGEAYETLKQRDMAIPLIAKALAHGHRTFEFERNPQLAALRADSAFVRALAAARGN